MARKSDGEKIDELGILTAVIEERLDNARRDLDDLNRQLEEDRRRWWMLVPPLVAAFVSAGLTAVVTFFFSRR
jgi:hypothetical protein